MEQEVSSGRPGLLCSPSVDLVGSKTLENFFIINYCQNSCARAFFILKSGWLHSVCGPRRFCFGLGVIGCTSLRLLR